MNGQWNPLYVAYCNALGESDPAAQIDKDKDRWSGGSMAGFLLWIDKKWQRFDAITNRHYRMGNYHSERGYAAFARWLEGGEI